MESTQTFAHTPQPTAPQPPSHTHQPPEAKRHEVHRIATELFKQQPDWVTFFRKVLGVDGIARQLFPTGPEMTSLEQSPEYNQIQQMLAKLRERGGSPTGCQRANSRHHGSFAKEPSRIASNRSSRKAHQHEQALHFKATSDGRRRLDPERLINHR